MDFYEEVGNQKWFTSLWRSLRAPNEGVEVRVTAVPDSSVLDHMLRRQSPLASLALQLRQIYGDWRSPPEPIEISAAPEPAALGGLIEHPSPLASVLGQIRAIFLDARNPPRFQPTAEPVDLPALWSERHLGMPSSLSIAAHVLVIALIFSGFAIRSEPGLRINETFVPLYIPADLVALPEEADPSSGGGGGGRRTLTAPSAGELPRAADEQFVPPAAEPPLNLDPLLVAEPTIVAPQLAALLPITLPDLGDPMAGIPAPPSSGPGVGGGIGTGQGRGVGEGSGPGFGAGEGGGFGGGVFGVGGGVSPPQILFRRDPIYSEDARKAQYEGTVILEAIVRKDGSVEIVRVVQGLGLGLDENAIEALKEWRFSPATRLGVPVDVAVNIEVNFTLR